MTNDKDQLAFELASAALMLWFATKRDDLGFAITGFVFRVMQAEGKKVQDISGSQLADLNSAAYAFAYVVRSCSDIDDVLILAAKRFLRDAEGAIG